MVQIQPHPIKINKDPTLHTWVHIRHLLRAEYLKSSLQITSSMMEQSMNMHKERSDSDLTLAAVNGTPV